MIFKKISAVLGAVLMTGLTLGTAAAATYPAPFVESGSGDVAIVYGTGTGVNPLDQTQAGNIQSDLSESLGGTTNVEGGELFELYDSDKLHFGDAMNAVFTELDDGDMTVALADGEYDSGSIEIDYEQSITLGSIVSELFNDEDVNNGAESVGYQFDSETVLTYTMTLKDGGANYSLMEETDFPLFGTDYYVLDVDASNDKITLLNSAEQDVITYGETKTLAGKQVSISYITDSSLKLIIDGETTDKLEEGDSYKLDDGSYVIVNENLNSDELANARAEISIGSGRVVLENGQDVEISNADGDLESVDGMAASITSSSSMVTALSITWATDDDVYLTEGDSIAMPVFEEYSLIFNGLILGDTTENIAIENGNQLVLSMGNYDVDLMYNDTTTQQLGTDDGLLHLDGSSATSKLYYLAKDDMFLATYLDSDVSDIETIYYEVTGLDNNTGDSFDLSLNDLAGFNSDVSLNAEGSGEVISQDDFDITVLAVYDSGSTILNAYNVSGNLYHNATDNEAQEDFVVLNVTHGGDTLHFEKVVSEEGMIIDLPTTAGASQTLTFYETTDDGDVDTGMSSSTFTVQTYWSSDDDLYGRIASGITMVTDDDNSDVSSGYSASDHAIYAEEDSDAHTLDLTFHADEVYADLAIVAGGTVSVSSDALGNVLIRDTEVSSSSASNLIVVGGSCINSAAATLLGGNHCGAAFTEATDVGTGEFLIKGFENSAIGGKFALLVAGYEAADTVNAATYLVNKEVDTSKEYIGTSSNTAELVVA